MREVLRSNKDSTMGYPMFLHSFPQSLQVNSVLIPQLGHYRSRTWPLQFVSHPKIQRFIAQVSGPPRVGWGPDEK